MIHITVFYNTPSHVTPVIIMTSLSPLTYLVHNKVLSLMVTLKITPLTLYTVTSTTV